MIWRVEKKNVEWLAYFMLDEMKERKGEQQHRANLHT